MKLSEQWLREWSNPDLTTEELCYKLTMSGLEVDSLTSVAEPFTHVIIAEVLQVTKHPEADRLKVCEVNIGEENPVTIVCGATNVRPHLKVAAALPGAALPHGVKISRSKIRNIVSNGMLCSARELGMSDESNGILELPQDAPVGQDVREYLGLSDNVIEVAITPNRGDCLSILGLAKDIVAITGCQLQTPEIKKSHPTIEETRPVSIKVPESCSRYAGRVIRNVKTDAITPIGMQERLRRAGVRTISPVVDVMNYVMLELGQPMHAFDLNTITGGIHVRMAKASESLALLDGQTVQLSPETMVIADDEKPLAIAGVMGGLDSSVTLLTKDIFLESAFFNPLSIARSVREYRLMSESSSRYERGIDPEIQVQALERATQLLQGIVGGEPGPIVEVIKSAELPHAIKISLREARIEKILGLKIVAAEVESILKRLGFHPEKTTDGWLVTVPPRRSDVTLEVDLIEEIIRLYGYEKLPTEKATAKLELTANQDEKINLLAIRKALCDFGFNEVITYSFIDEKLQQLFDPNCPPKRLVNPITADMSVMRTNMWPGLVTTLLYNQNRQQPRMRLFETGLTFIEKNGALRQLNVLGGLISGTAHPMQWGEPARAVDFFDLKGDLEKLLQGTFGIEAYQFKSGVHPALHPGQTAEIYLKDQQIGIVGALHPALMQTLDLTEKTIVFELWLDQIEKNSSPRFKEISKYPEIRRDIAFFVDQTVPSQQIQDTIRDVGGELLRDITVFDVYQGKGVAPHRKSIALALTLQHDSRTLVDEEVANVVEQIIVALKERFAAELRG